MENLLSPELLRRLAWSPPEPLTSDAVAAALRVGGAREWQVNLTAAALAGALAPAPVAVDDPGDIGEARP